LRRKAIAYLTTDWWIAAILNLGNQDELAVLMGSNSFSIKEIWKVYPYFIDDCDHLVSKTAMTRVEGENSRLRHYLARLHHKIFCYSKSIEMLEVSVRLLTYYLKHRMIPAF
jgi:insertion element IS1 protein InsB